MSKWIIGMKVQQMSPACYNHVSYFALLSLNYLPMSRKWRYKRNLYPYLVLWQYGGLRRFSFLRYFSLWTVQVSMHHQDVFEQGTTETCWSSLCKLQEVECRAPRRGSTVIQNFSDVTRSPFWRSHMKDAALFTTSWKVKRFNRSLLLSWKQSGCSQK